MLAWQRHDTMVRPWVAAVVLGVMFAWSIGLLFYRRRTVRVVVIEVTIAVVGILATLLAESPEAIAAGQFTIPTIWAAGSVAGGAVVAGAKGGLVAAAVIVAADLVEVGGSPTQATVHNIVLLVLLGGLVGLAVDLAHTGLEQEEQVLLERERLHERERIARVVHDGVLQSLAFIHRRGEEIGGESAPLAVIAAEQERALRRFVSGTGAPDGLTDTDLRGAEGAEVDLRVLLTAHERPDVGVAVPADPVVVDRLVATEVDAAVAAALDNVVRHAGVGAHAWVLLEGDAQGIELTIRDNGVGADLTDLLDAARRGRMGVSASIRGRVEDLGGTVTWSTRPGGGCVVRMTVPRTGAAHPAASSPHPQPSREPR